MQIWYLYRVNPENVFSITVNSKLLMKFYTSINMIKYIKIHNYMNDFGYLKFMLIGTYDNEGIYD